jgi:hypothetical protein
VPADGDPPKAEPPERGRESLADWAKERIHYGREIYLCLHERKDEDDEDDLWECLDCLATSYDDEISHEELRFWDMPIHKKITLREWVRQNMVPAEEEYSSYYLKHEAERGLGFYVADGELQGAMLEAGYLPTAKIGSQFKYAPRKDLERRFAVEALFLLEGLQMWAYRVRRCLYLRNRGEV